MKASNLSELSKPTTKKISFFVIYRIFRYLGKKIWIIGVANILVILLMFLNFKIASEAGLIIDRINEDKIIGYPFIEIVGPIFLYCILIRVIGTIQFSITMYAANEAISKLRTHFYDNLMNLSKRFYDNHKVGWLIARSTGDMGVLTDFMKYANMMITVSISGYILACYYMIQVSPILFLPAFLVVPLGIFCTVWFKKRMQNDQVQLREANSRLVGYLSENIRGIRVVQAFAREYKNKQLFKGHNTKNYDLGVSISRLNGFFIPSIEFLTIMGITLVMGFGTWLMNSKYAWITNPITPGQLAAFLLYINMLITPSKFLVDLFSIGISAVTAANRIFEIVDMKPEIEDHKQAVEIKEVKGRIRFENVSFRYNNDDPWILDKLDLDIQAQETIAFVGETGAGKTTTANLIARFYDVNNGVIKIDDQDIKSLALESLYQNMGIVLQEDFLFSGSILNNLRFRNPDLSQQDVIEITKKLGTHHSIMNLPNGYEYMVGEGGNSISQGQRQIISLSRALIADPKILILDEATSAIDTYTESVITKALNYLIKGRTTIIIAHRVSTIKKVDRVIVFGNGGIIEEGTYHELLLQQGHFWKLSGELATC